MKNVITSLFCLIILLFPGIVSGVTVSYTYDAVGRLIDCQYGSQSVITYTYDRAGNVTELDSHFLYFPGDLNADQKLSLEDVILSLKLLSGQLSSDFPFTITADVNDDQKIDHAEAIYILENISD